MGNMSNMSPNTTQGLQLMPPIVSPLTPVQSPSNSSPFSIQLSLQKTVSLPITHLNPLLSAISEEQSKDIVPDSVEMKDTLISVDPSQSNGSTKLFCDDLLADECTDDWIEIPELDGTVYPATL